jgi:regulator of protease activity HflC (stomatin/prohibitin superfamily)
VLYLISNVRRIEPHQEALVLRLGRLDRVVNRPGLVWAFPFPIDEIVPLPTKKSEIIKVMLTDFDEDEGVLIVERPAAEAAA